MATGGSGTGVAQDATIQAILAKLGASTPQGGSGTGIAQDASLQALLAAITPGSSGAPSAIIFRPGVATAAPAFETWAEIQTAIAAADDAVVVYVDSSNAAAHVTADTGTTSCAGAVVLAGFTQGQNNDSGALANILTIDDGATLDRLRGITGFLEVVCNSRTADSLTFTQTATDFDTLLISFGGQLRMASTATIPAIQTTGVLGITLFGLVTFGTPGGSHPVVNVADGATLQIAAYSTANVTAASIEGTAAAVLSYLHDDTNPLPTFASFLGSLNEDRASLAQWATPSAGVTASRPTSTNSQVGQIFYDTTIGGLFVWSGAAWVSVLSPWSATVNANNNAIQNVKTATFNGEIANGNSGTAATINWQTGQKQTITLTGNVTFTFGAPLGVGNFLLRLVQDGTGSRTASWPGTVKWVGGAAPTLSTAAGAVDIVSFYWNGTNYYGSAGIGFA
jgi:hypothetical protein